MGKCKFSCKISEDGRGMCFRVITLDDIGNQDGGPFCEGTEEDKKDCPEWSGKK